MTYKAGGDSQALPAASPAVEDQPVLADGIASGAFLGQPASQALGMAIGQNNFTFDGRDADNKFEMSADDWD